MSIHPRQADVAKNYVRPVRANLLQTFIAGVGNHGRMIEEVQYLAQTIGGVAIVFDDENAPWLRRSLRGEGTRLGDI